MSPLIHYQKMKRAVVARHARRMREIAELNQSIARDQARDNDRLRYMTQAEINKKR